MAILTLVISGGAGRRRRCRVGRDRPTRRSRRLRRPSSPRSL